MRESTSISRPTVVHFSATFFHNDFRDIVSFTYSGPQNCPAYGGSYFNTDKARADGVNSSFEVKATRWLNIGGNYSYDDSKVLAAPNALRSGAGSRQPPVPPAAALRQSGRQCPFPADELEHRRILRGPAHRQRLPWAGPYEQSELCAVGSFKQHRSGPRIFHGGSFRKPLRSPLPGCDRISRARVTTTASV